MSRRRHPHVSCTPETPEDVMARLLTRSGFGEQIYKLDIFRRWPEAVGPKIASVTAPVSFVRGVLTVRAASATWQNELAYLRGTILAKLNGLLEASFVRELKVMSGHLPKKPKAPPQRAPSAEERQSAHEVAAPIGDADVRDAFVALMAQGLSRQPRQEG